MVMTLQSSWPCSDYAKNEGAVTSRRSSEGEMSTRWRGKIRPKYSPRQSDILYIRIDLIS